MEPCQELNFEAIYKTYYPGVLERVRMRVPVDDADDVTQEIFLSLWKNIQLPDDSKSKFQGKSKFGTWFRGVERNTIGNYYRKAFRNERRIEAASTLNVLRKTIPEGATFLAIYLMTEAVLEQLPSHYREMLELRWLEGLNYGEIAKRLDIHYEAGRSRYRRAMEMARKIMEGESVEWNG
jgi:RNA polymerase sigma factor (sigma-70 family)